MLSLVLLYNIKQNLNVHVLARLPVPGYFHTVFRVASTNGI